MKPSDEATVSGKSIREIASEAEVADSDVIRSLDQAYHGEGGIAILRGNLAEEGCVIKQSAVVDSMRHFEGPARVFDSEEAAYAYERERYRSHLMLVDLAFAQRPPDEETRTRVLALVDGARVLQERAEGLAGGGRYAQALAILEDATSGLVRACRQAGLLIP